MVWRVAAARGHVGPTGVGVGEGGEDRRLSGRDDWVDHSSQWRDQRSFTRDRQRATLDLARLVSQVMAADSGSIGPASSHVIHEWLRVPTSIRRASGVSLRHADGPVLSRTGKSEIHDHPQYGVDRVSCCWDDLVAARAFERCNSDCYQRIRLNMKTTVRSQAEDRNACATGVLCSGRLQRSTTSSCHRPWLCPVGFLGPYGERRGAVSRGFTLVELLLVIALIAVLVALTLPGLGGSREAAVRATGLSYLRSHVAIMAQYSSDYKDSFPYFTDPGATTTVIRTARGDVVSLRYFEAFAFWNYALADGYYNGNPDDQSFYPGRPIAGGPTLLSYGCCFIADPGFWNPRTRTWTGQFHPTRLSSVRHPSKKALLSWFDTTRFDIPNNIIDPSWQTLPVGLGIVDGSARSIPLKDVVYGYQSGDGSILNSVHLNDSPPALHTLDGIYGRDVP